MVAENIQDWNLETAVAYFGQNKMKKRDIFKCLNQISIAIILNVGSNFMEWPVGFE